MPVASVPAAPAGAPGPAILHSLAGRLGQALAVVFEPLGFPWQVCIALVPAMAAREVVVSALGTVYALSAVGDDTAQALVPLIQAGWSLPSALALMAWFVFAPQCIATFATLRRETDGWRLAFLDRLLSAAALLPGLVSYMGYSLLLEELGAPYEIKRYQRNAETRLAPPVARARPATAVASASHDVRWKTTPMSSKWWVISWPITMPMPPKLVASSALAEKKGGCRMPAGKTISLSWGL